ncbi:MAG TPA: YIP1 family protein [Polyangiaceae bacterium]|nr:YIP1 family protein [Polyangiaceae bacterium]
MTTEGGPSAGGWAEAPVPTGLPPGFRHPDAPAAGAAAAQAAAPIPWEARASLGVAPAFARTLRQSLFSPAGFFGRVGESDELADALLFAFACAVGAQIAQTLADALGVALFRASFFQLLERALGASLGWAAPAPEEHNPYFYFGRLFFGPPAYVASIFVSSALAHGLLMAVGGARRSYYVTVRAVAYASGVLLFAFVPFVGALLLAPAWGVVLHIVGLARAHQTDGGRAAFAVLAPYACLCACAVASIVAFAGAVLQLLRVTLGSP